MLIDMSAKKTLGNVPKDSNPANQTDHLQENCHYITKKTKLAKTSSCENQEFQNTKKPSLPKTLLVELLVLRIQIISKSLMKGALFQGFGFLWGLELYVD
jgi:hypothetical protein